MAKKKLVVTTTVEYDYTGGTVGEHEEFEEKLIQAVKSAACDVVNEVKNDYIGIRSSRKFIDRSAISVDAFFREER